MRVKIVKVSSKPFQGLPLSADSGTPHAFLWKIFRTLALQNAPMVFSIERNAVVSVTIQQRYSVSPHFLKGHERILKKSCVHQH